MEATCSPSESCRKKSLGTGNGVLPGSCWGAVGELAASAADVDQAPVDLAGPLRVATPINTVGSLLESVVLL